MDDELVDVEVEMAETRVYKFPISTLFDEDYLEEVTDLYAEAFNRLCNGDYKIVVSFYPDRKDVNLEFWHGVDGWGDLHYGFGLTVKESDVEKDTIKFIPALIDQIDWEEVFSCLK